MNGVRIRVNIPLGKQNQLMWKVKSETEAKMDFRQKNCKNLLRSAYKCIHNLFQTYNNVICLRKMIFYAFKAGCLKQA